MYFKCHQLPLCCPDSQQPQSPVPTSADPAFQYYSHNLLASWDLFIYYLLLQPHFCLSSKSMQGRVHRLPWKITLGLRYSPFEKPGYTESSTSRDISAVRTPTHQTDQCPSQSVGGWTRLHETLSPTSMRQFNAAGQICFAVIIRPCKLHHCASNYM